MIFEPRHAGAFQLRTSDFTLSVETDGREDSSRGGSWSGLREARVAGRPGDLREFSDPAFPLRIRREVFLAADTPRGQARSAMAGDMLRLSALLSARPDISVSHALMFGESHMSMVEPAARRGLRTLYGSELEQ